MSKERKKCDDFMRLKMNNDNTRCTSRKSSENYNIRCDLNINHESSIVLVRISIKPHRGSLCDILGE